MCGIHSDAPHGLVVCDECEAIWQEPDTATEHVYPDAENARCPICEAALWGPHSRWASRADCRVLGWEAAIDEDLSGP